MLNRGSYIGIPRSIRAEVGPICEKFIQDHIAAGKDFATETTLRSAIVFDQMKQAHSAGFEVRFIYVCVDRLDTSVRRVKIRAHMGGHSGSEDTVLDIRAKSLANFPRALDELGRSIDFLEVYDNSIHGTPPKLVASFQSREISFLDLDTPEWMDQALAQTPYSTQSLRGCCQQGRSLPDAAPPNPGS